MKKIIIFGATDEAEMSQFYFKHDSEYTPHAFTVHENYIKSETFNDLPLVPFEQITSLFPPSEYRMFVAVGYSKLNTIRTNICQEAITKGYQLINYISSKAIIWPGFICGHNCLILELNNIQPFVKIGNNVTLWSGNHVGHHSIIGDNCFIASHVVISGRVKIENNCFIGVNSTIRDNIIIAKKSVIGAGAIISENTREGGIYIPQATMISTVSNRLNKS